MSAPARAEAQSLRALQTEIKATEQEIRRLRAAQIDFREMGARHQAAGVGFDIARMRLQISATKDAAKERKSIEDALTPKMRTKLLPPDIGHFVEQVKELKGGGGGVGFFDDLNRSLIGNITAGNLAASAIEGVASSVVHLVEGMARLTLQSAEYIVEVSEFRRNTETAFEVIRGTSEEGRRAFADFEDLGRRVHMPVEQAEGIAQRLMLQGEENMQTVKGVVRAVSELQRTGLQRGADALENIIERSLTSGTLKLPRFVKELGVSLPEFYKSLADRTHQGVEQVKKEIKSGTFTDVEAGIQELTAAISGGKVGQAAEKKLGIGDAITDIKNDVRSLFENIDASPIAGAIERARLLFEDTFGEVDQGAKDFGKVLVDAVTEGIDQVVLFGLKLKLTYLEAKLAAGDAFDAKNVKSFADGISLALDDMKGLAKAAKDTYDSVALMADILTLGAKHWAIPLLGEIEFQGEDAYLNRQARERAGAERPIQAEPHATGGVVQPADGEIFASVAPGETIVPVGGFDGGGRGDTRVTVEAGAVQIHAPHGTTATKEEMQQLSEQAVTDLIERLVAELGG